MKRRHVFGLRAGCAVASILGLAARTHAQLVDVSCDEPGWNWVDVGIALTANQPTYWSAATGLGGGAVPPLTILDPGPPPGRPALDGTGERVLRGFIIAWAVNADGAEIRWNHLKGDALIVNYARGAAWEYTASAFQAVDPAVAHGAVLGLTPGDLFLDGSEYDNGFDLLLLDFYATGSQPFGLNSYFALDTALTLMPLDIDVRQETDGPVTTKASFTVWNQNETKLTGLDRCVTCWDDTLFSQYGIPNHFLAENLQTNKGKAQIDGLPSQLCNVDFDPGDGLALGADPRDVVSRAAALIGVSVKHLDPGITLVANDNGHGGGRSDAGEGIIGMGVQGGLIQADVIGISPPERPAPAPLQQVAVQKAVRRGVNSAGNPAQAPGDVRAPSDRLSGNEKGSLLIFPKVELRWDATGQVLHQDTFIDLTNDFPGDVQVQMYFVQGDPPFTSDGIDANTNGVADDCEDRIQWACGGALPRDVGLFRGCEPNVYGPYGSLVECAADCSPRYSCGFMRGNGNSCTLDPHGEFATYEECAIACQRYDCVQEVRGLTECIADTNGAYATLGDCEADCGTRYSCTETANGPECLANSNGEFATLGECQDACQRHSCQTDGSCTPDASGAYATLSACAANCGVRYSCSADTGARSSGCYEDASGVYATLAECETDCQGYQCNSVSGVLTCVPDAISPSYGSRAQCEFVCERTYDCDTNGQCVSGSTYTENDCVNNNVCQN